MLVGCGPAVGVAPAPPRGEVHAEQAPEPPPRTPSASVVASLQYADGGEPSDLTLRANGFASCRKGEVTGWVVVSLRVEADGSVHDVEATDHAGLDEVTVTCIVDRLRAANLGSPGAGSARVVAYVGLR